MVRYLIPPALPGHNRRPEHTRSHPIKFSHLRTGTICSAAFEKLRLGSLTPEIPSPVQIICWYEPRHFVWAGCFGALIAVQLGPHHNSTYHHTRLSIPTTSFLRL
ncbi:hypothetical protein PCASD_03683 [Puccinia coronata f. sp. avenae]|uniref:Uncharacterized protein n=1 Tax=Puccinia coronata f. sp. avenae TaxID=200324 RepID=A0A2N5V9K0_9BASI|nr:hypothetical protein PCASD_15683 [Puccinia coronata f. sp. avenae]PLW46669.1 hypothetical protein PCASD_03683 [Puccinia coronata f. sp. avenae]